MKLAYFGSPHVGGAEAVDRAAKRFNVDLMGFRSDCSPSAAPLAVQNERGMDREDQEQQEQHHGGRYASLGEDDAGAPEAETERHQYRCYERWSKPRLEQKMMKMLAIGGEGTAAPRPPADDKAERVAGGHGRSEKERHERGRSPCATPISTV